MGGRRGRDATRTRRRARAPEPATDEYAAARGRDGGRTATTGGAAERRDGERRAELTTTAGGAAGRRWPRGGGRRARRGAAGRRRRRAAAPLLAALAALLVLAVIGAVALAGRGDGGGDDTPQAQSTPEATATATAEKTADARSRRRRRRDAGADGHADAGADRPRPPTPEPTETPTPAPDAGRRRPATRSALQAKGHTALPGGDIQTRAHQPQGRGRAVRRRAPGRSRAPTRCTTTARRSLPAGQPDEAVQILEARLARFDNQNGTVRELLKKARKAAKDDERGGHYPSVDARGRASGASRASVTTASAAWAPWSRLPPPVRASAWSMFSTVSTPNAHGTPVRSWTSMIPRAASEQT